MATGQSPAAPRKKRDALRRARELYEEFCERATDGSPFDFADYRAALPDALLEFGGLAFAGFVQNIAEIIDRESTRDRDGEQPTLFDVGGVYKLGDGRRMPKR